MGKPPLRIGIVAGEASGDILGAGLMQEILKRHPDASFEGIGGERMLALGFKSYFPQDRLAVMGLIEPLKRLFELLRIRRYIINHFVQRPPDVFIGIDSPDFNLTIEEKLRASGIKTAHYVSPSVWAWRQKRVIKIARAVDLMMTLLPFEARFYREHRVPVKFVGHPLADEIPVEVPREEARKALGIEPDKTLIALMPGSRSGEVSLLGPLYWQAAELCLNHDASLEFIVPAANSDRKSQIEDQLRSHPALPIKVVDGRSHQVMAAADLILMTSGTTTLEAMLFKKPMVVAYKLSPLSFWIIIRLVNTKYFSLPNLLADKPLVPEILQADVTPERLCAELMNLLANQSHRNQLVSQFRELHESLRLDASSKAAEAVLALIDEQDID